MKPPSMTVLSLKAFLALALTAAAVHAGEGAVTRETIAALRASMRMDDHARAMYNAVTNADINQLSLNRDVLRQHNEIFSHRIKTSTVTNQSASGRCWLFAALNVLRPDVVQKHKMGNFEFSQNYLAFWDKVEKANCFLEDVIELADRDPLDREMQTVFSRAGWDDGWWEYAIALIKKYGVVPKEIMPETHSSSNVALMNAVIRARLKVEAMRLRRLKQEGKSLADLRAAKLKAIGEVYRVLVVNLGEPPAEFRWRFEDKDSKLSEFRTYTPQSFWKDWVGGVDLDQYVQLGNHPGQQYGALYQVTHSRNLWDGPDIRYLNMKVEVLKEAALKSVLDKQPVWFAADVGKDQDNQRGIMAAGLHDYASMFGAKEKLTKAERLSYCEGGPNHAMVFMGVDVQQNLPAKWLVENSWGKDRGHEGYWSLYDDWFTEHVYLVVVKRTYLPPEVLKRFEQMPVMLPRWHPMAQASD